MILYGAPLPAPNPRRVRIYLAERGIDLKETPLSLPAREHKSDEHKARNSLGQVPTLVLDDGTAISETVAICRYLEETTEGPPLFGTTPKEHALIEMWIRRNEFQLMIPVGQFWRHAHPLTARLLTQFNDFGHSNRATYETTQAWLDGELAKGGPFLTGETYTMADICALTTIDFAKWIGLPIREDLPALASWHARVSARPSAAA